jgi:hypothetical protein
MGIAESGADLDARLLIDALDRAVQPWPDDIDKTG